MKRIRTYVFVFVPVFVDSGAHASSVRRRASCSLHPDGQNAVFGGNVRQDAEHGTLEARAPQNLPFWTWFVYNPRPPAKPPCSE
jgi:hypothetical protein